MRGITAAVLLGFAVLATAYVTKEVKYADKDFLFKQKTILEILHHVFQYDEHSQYYKDALVWKFENHFDKFENFL